MLLPFRDGLVPTSPFDDECRQMADRHYTRQSHGSPQFAGNGKKHVLRDAAGVELFVWLWQDFRWDAQTGYNCAIFRNEGERRSSDVILEAERSVVEKWGPRRAFTFIDPTQIRSVNPGYCFKCAGWTFAGRSQSGKDILEKYLKAASPSTRQERPDK